MDVHLVTIKVSIIWLADALVESQGPKRHDPRLVSHDGHSVQTRLTVEEHTVAILKVALHDVSVLELAGYLLSEVFVHYVQQMAGLVGLFGV